MGDSVVVVETILTGSTGRELRKHPAEVREMQFYLIACPENNRYGLYICELDIASARLGRTVKRIQESMRVLVDLEFCRFDEDTQWVWILEMAQHQFGLPLKANDYRCSAARKWYAALPVNPFAGDWYDRYVQDFDLTDRVHDGRWGVDRKDRRREPRELQGVDKGVSEGLSQPRSNGDPDLFAGEGVIGGSGGKEGEDALPALDERLKGKALEAAFEQCMAIYPKQEERKEARAEFGRIKPTRRLAEQILASIVAHKGGQGWADEGGKYIPRFVNFLKKRRWEDRVVPARAQLTQRNEKNRQAGEAFLNRRRGEPV